MTEVRRTCSNAITERGSNDVVIVRWDQSRRGYVFYLLRVQGLVDANSSVMPVGSAVTSDSSLGGAPFGPPDTADADADDTENSEELSYNDVKNVFNEMTGLLDGPFPVPTLDQFVGLGTAVAGDLGDGAYAEVVNSMESGWTFGNIITQGTLHFAPARDPAVGCVSHRVLRSDLAYRW